MTIKVVSYEGAKAGGWLVEHADSAHVTTWDTIGTHEHRIQVSGKHDGCTFVRVWRVQDRLVSIVDRFYVGHKSTLLIMLPDDQQVDVRKVDTKPLADSFFKRDTAWQRVIT
jgi:hypothetical protein